MGKTAKSFTWGKRFGILSDSKIAFHGGEGIGNTIFVYNFILKMKQCFAAQHDHVKCVFTVIKLT